MKISKLATPKGGFSFRGANKLHNIGLDTPLNLRGSTYQVTAGKGQQEANVNSTVLLLAVAPDIVVKYNNSSLLSDPGLKAGQNAGTAINTFSYLYVKMTKRENISSLVKNQISDTLFEVELETDEVLTGIVRMLSSGIILK